MDVRVEENEAFGCCGSTQFAKQMALSSPFLSLQDAITAARDIWLNKVNVDGWLQAFSAHPQIGQQQAPPSANEASAQWSKGEQSTAFATATDSSKKELEDWNRWYFKKFGFIFIICASGRSTSEILGELKKRYLNRPIVEFEIAAQEQMKITELRLTKLFSTKEGGTLRPDSDPGQLAKKAEEDRVGIIGAHLTAGAETASHKTSQSTGRIRPPITTHVLDVSRGSPASGLEVQLEIWRGTSPRPKFGETDASCWILLGSSSTNKDGRSGQLMSIVDAVDPGIYRISFNTSQYCPGGFFPYVSIVFEIRETQKLEHFHVPLLLSPFSFTTYRGS